MREVQLARSFRRDVKLARRRDKDLSKLETVMRLLASSHVLPAQYRDHPLRGDFRGSRDCHLEPDWIVIYTLDDDAGFVRFERTGTHADLFR